MELISRDEVMRLAESGKLLSGSFGERAKDIIKAIPTAEPKVGKWIWNPDGIDWGLGAWVCSKCKCKPETWWEADKRYNPYQCAGGHFCGNCGARMKGADDE